VCSDARSNTLHVQLRLQQPGECSQLRNRSAHSTAGRQPAARGERKKKTALRGRPRTTTSRLNFIDILFFCRFFGLRRSGKASVNRVTRTRPADAMRKTPRQLHAAPFRRRVHADMSSMSSVRVRGGSRKAAPLPHPPRCKYVFCFLKREDLQ